MKKFLIIFIAILAINLGGCASTDEGNSFKFLSKDFDLFVGEERTIELFVSKQDEKYDIYFTMENKETESYFLNDESLEDTLLVVLGDRRKFDENDSISAKSKIIKVKALKPGFVNLYAHLDGYDNVIDVITIEIKEVELRGLQLTFDKSFYYVSDQKIVMQIIPYPVNIEETYRIETTNPSVVDYVNGELIIKKAGEVTILVFSNSNPEIYTEKNLTIR